MSSSSRDGARSRQSEGNGSLNDGKADVVHSQKRAKRSRYISIACNECKRRKIKCNGETPCRRCGHLDLQCVYATNAINNFKETQEFQQMTVQINTLQQAVESLTANMSFTRTSEGARPNPVSPASVQPTARAPSYSFAPSLPSPVIRPPDIEAAGSSLRTGATESSYPPYPAYSHFTNEPIWAIAKEESIRLINVWKETIQPTLPIIHTDRTIHHIDMLYSFLDDANRARLAMTDVANADIMKSAETLKLKLVLATSMAVEGSADGDLGCQLFTSVVCVSEQLLFKPVNLENLELLVLTAICAFYKDDEHLAWRLIGLTGRMLFEFGIQSNHRMEAIFQTKADLFRATQIVWIIFVLDRRWSLSTDLPSAIQDDDIDHFRPSASYLYRVIELVEISWKVLSKFIAKQTHQPLQNLESLEQMDRDIYTWYSRLPRSIQCDSLNGLPGNVPADTYSTTPLLLHLRTNQTRIAVTHPALLSSASLQNHSQLADSIINIAKNTIATLQSLVQPSPYSAQHRIINYFLMSSLTAIFIAAIQVPERFNSSSRDHFYAALDLIRAEKPHSFMGRRLLRTLKVLNQVAHLVKTGNDSDTEAAVSSTSCVSMMPIDMLSPTRRVPPSLISDILTPDDRMEDMIAGLISFYEAPGSGQSQDLGRHDALTRIFKDLY